MECLMWSVDRFRWATVASSEVHMLVRNRYNLKTNNQPLKAIVGFIYVGKGFQLNTSVADPHL